MSAKHTPVAEWQARVKPDGAWRRIDPPPGETLESRVVYLRSLPAYEVRALYEQTPTTEAAPLLLNALECMLERAQVMDPFTEQQARAAIAAARGEA